MRGGRSIDTTTGFTPLEGLMTATRAGDVDPGLLLWLQQEAGMDAGALAELLEHRSGLAGLSGRTGDLREVLAGREEGDPDCRLAFDVYVHRIRRSIGAMVASLGGIDVLVFTGGVGEGSVEVRAQVTSGLAHLGIAFHDARNAGVGEGPITEQGCEVAALVVPAGEDLEIARQVQGLLAGATDRVRAR